MCTQALAANGTRIAFPFCSGGFFLDRRGVPISTWEKWGITGTMTGKNRKIELANLSKFCKMV